MRILALSFLFLCTLYPSVFAQKRGLERDSLPVFIIQDPELAFIIDTFIADSQKFINNSSVTFHININLGNDQMSVSLELKEQNENSDSLILYKNSHCHQAFIQHDDILFFAYIKSSTYAYNYDKLSKMIKRLSNKHSIYFQDPPPDFYDISEWGGNPLEGLLFFSFHEYADKKWYHGMRMFEDDH